MAPVFLKNLSPAGETAELSPMMIVPVAEDDESHADLLRRGFLKADVKADLLNRNSDR